MSEEKPDFLRRWSRLKREAAATAPPKPAPAAPEKPPELPSIDSLNFDSDFTGFMKAKVDESLKRAALKKLFADPRFNYMDGLDVWTGDYTGEDPIPEDMLAQLEHAKQTLFGPRQAQEKDGEAEQKAQTSHAQAEAPQPQAEAPQPQAEVPQTQAEAPQPQASKDDGDQRQDA